jgi:phage terminase large subunit GpA-like protein
VARQLLGTDWQREDGAGLRIDRLMIDANWGQSTTVVRTFAKQSPFAAQLVPSHGRGIGASSQPLTDKQKHRGDKVGLNWRIGKLGDSDVRSCLYDANYWKTFCAARLRLAIGDPEALTLHQGDHDLLLEHLTAEYPVRTEARGRVVDEWKMAGRDNHWWDCLVGAAVAASLTGLQPTASEAGGRRRRKAEIPTTPGAGRRIEIRRLGT